MPKEMQKATDLPAGNMKRFILIAICISIVISASVGPVHAQPVVTVLQATGITDTSARLEGFVNPNGQDTEWYFFVWTDDPGPHNNNNINCPSSPGHLPGSDAIDPVSCTVQVDPSTTYSFVLVAKWSGGQSATSDTLKFTTLSPLVIVTATMISLHTDWALSNPTMSPAHPKVGDRVAFAVTLTALSSNAGYPQTVRFTFALDGTPVFFDEGKFDYPGPTGSPIRLEAGTDPREVWLATSGSHMAEWTVEPAIGGLIVTDPNMANNHVSLPFSVGGTADYQTLTTHVSPPGSGSVVVGAAEPCPGTCSFQIIVGSKGDVGAIPATGWAFSSWTITGATCPTGLTTNPCLNLVMPNNPVSITAVFTPTGPTGPALDISVVPATRTVTAGSSITFTVTVPYIPCIPPDCPTITLGSHHWELMGTMTVTFSPSQYTFTATRSDFISTMSVDVGSSLPAGSYNVDVIATSDMSMGGVREKGTTVTVEVTTATTTSAGPVFGFNIALSPGSVEVKQGEAAHYRILLTYSDPSYSGTDVKIQVSGLGSGMDWHLTTSGVAIETSPTTPTGTYTITATGSAMGVTRQASATLVVTSGQPPQTSTTVLPPPQQRSTILVTTTKTTMPPPGPGFPDLTWIIIGILAVLIVIFAAFALRRRGSAPPPAPPPSAQPTQPAPPTPTEKTKPSSLYCVDCGTENPSTNEFCGRCGKKLLRE